VIVGGGLSADDEDEVLRHSSSSGNERRPTWLRPRCASASLASASGSAPESWTSTT